jgi:subtilisin family serine protease
MVMRKVPVVSIALAGPPNALLARAVARARERGLFLVAPVGNAGPAAPPAYPASYPSVIAVTAVDRRNRVLIEAGRSPSIAFTAPGAELLAASPEGGWSQVRGTSFAVPLVASRLVAARNADGEPMSLLRREAADIGPSGFDKIYGWGLLCARCR